MNNEEIGAKFPLLASLCALRGIPVLPIWTTKDLAQLLGYAVRTIQDWIVDRKITPRKLIGRGRFLCEDIERLLEAVGDDPSQEKP